MATRAGAGVKGNLGAGTRGAAVVEVGLGARTGCLAGAGAKVGLGMGAGVRIETGVGMRMAVGVD